MAPPSPTKWSEAMHTATDVTVFMPLTYNLRRVINGGCQCPHCKAHPHEVPMWDTLAAHPDSKYSWVVHYPELTKNTAG